MSYKPEGHTSVSPYLIVDNAEKTLAFVRAVFGSEAIFVHRDSGGRTVHVEFRIDDTVVMCGESPGGPAANVHVYVPDVDGAFARAVEAGGSVAQEVSEQGDGDRRGGVTDPSGTTWWLSTQITPREA